MSYQNILLYSRAMPQYDDIDEDKDRPLYDDTLDACNPDNFQTLSGTQYIRA